MFLLRNIKGDDAKLKEFEIVYRDGAVHGLKIEILADEKPRPKLELIKDEKD
jgi:hypothetical protein